MFIAIISDIHNNLDNLKKCLFWCSDNKVEKIICCGDVADLNTMTYLAQNFSGEIFVVEGNAETYREADLGIFPNINYCGEIGVTDFEGVNIGFCHEPEKINDLSEAAPAPLDFIFHGHTHKPWLENKNGSIIANPGTLAGQEHQATFATLETKTKKLELKILNDL